jgi:hypothetical protein
MRKLGLSALLFSNLFALSACDYLLEKNGFDYTPYKSIYDLKSKMYVEVGSLDSISSNGFGVYVFNDKLPSRTFDQEWRAVILVSGIIGGPPDLKFDGNCYILTVDFRYGSQLIEKFQVPNSGSVICFELKPDRGPKGGFKE